MFDLSKKTIVIFGGTGELMGCIAKALFNNNANFNFQTTNLNLNNNLRTNLWFRKENKKE